MGIPSPLLALFIEMLPKAHLTSHSWSCFCFGYISSLFPELFFHSSLVAYWAPPILGSSSFSVLSFCHFILFMGFSRQEHWSCLPFPPPVDHILSELSTMTWVALHSLAHSFIELGRLWSMWLDWLVFCDCGFQSVDSLVEKDEAYGSFLME